MADHTRDTQAPATTGSGPGRTTPPASAPPPDDSDAADARVSSREALRFLTRAGRALAASLDYDETLRRVVRHAIPRIACFAAIDVLRADGRLERVAFDHIEEAKRPLLEVEHPFEPREEGWLPIAPVVEEGRSLLIERVEELDVDEKAGEELLRRVRSLDGRSLIIVPLSAHGERIGVIAFGSTRTDRFYGPPDLALAQELARTAALAIENARLYRKAEAAIRARDEVLSVVSHDLRNPVQRVRLAAELLLETDAVVPERRRTVEMIDRATTEMNRLIGDLLDVSRIEAGTLSLAAGPVDTGALVERLDAEYAPVASERGIEWRVEVPPDAPTLELDEGRIRQALGNLIGNAFKFTPRGGSVTLALRRPPDGGCEIEVRDTGPGMTAEEVARVFDRFWQARKGDRRGAGLGLAIARGIAQAHGGDLVVRSEPGRGSVFSLVLQPVPEERA